MNTFLQLRHHRLALDTPKVMGVLNVTPDSFSDGGRYLKMDALLAQAQCMVDEGVALFDVGGESSRPGAEPVSEQAELDRVMPVIEALTARFELPVSVDTYKPAVMAAASKAGAEMVNDIRALQTPGALEVVAATGMAVCLMHMQGDPRTMQVAPCYRGSIVDAVQDFLTERVQRCLAAGIAPERIALDPGIGFGKTLAHNLSLLAATSRFVAMGYPVLLGVSRKSMFGQLLGLDVDARDPASAVTAALAVSQGAHIVRAHAVGATVQALSIAMALRDAR